MKASLESQIPGIEVTLIDGKGGVFEVMRGSELIFSKKATGRFPEHEEIFEKLQ